MVIEMVDVTILHDSQDKVYDSSIVFTGKETKNQLIMFLGLIEQMKFEVFRELEGKE